MTPTAHRRTTRQHGYSLVEVMVATSVFLMFSATSSTVLVRAQAASARASVQTGAQYAMDFMTSRIGMGLGNYAPVPRVNGVVNYDAGGTASNATTVSWPYGRLTAPFDGRQEDYANPNLYRASVAYRGRPTTALGSYPITGALYDVTICFKVIDSPNGEDCMTQTVNGPMPDPTVTPPT